MKERKGTRDDGKIVISSLVYKTTPDTERNFQKIVDLILGVDTRRGGGYNPQPPEPCGVTRSCGQ